MSSRQLNKLIKSLKRTNTIGTSTADQLRSIERASNKRSQGWKSILDQKYKPSFEEKLFDLGAATIDAYPAVSDQREANLHNRMSNFTTLLSGITNEQALHNLGQNFNNTLGAVGNNADLRLLASAFKNEYDKKKQEMSNFNLGMQQLSGFYGEATELQPSDVQGFKLDQVRTKLDSIRRSKQLLSGGAIINQQGSPVGLNWSANDEFKDADGNVLNQEEMLRKVNQYEGTILKSVEALMRDGIITEKELEFIISPDSTYNDFLKASNSAMAMANTNANKTGSVANALLSKSQQIAKFLAQSKYKASDGLDEFTMKGVQDIISEESGFENAQSLSEDPNFSKQYLNQTQGNYSSADVLDDYNPETATMFETDLYSLADYYKQKSDSFRDMETTYQALGYKWSPYQDIVPVNLMGKSPALEDSYDPSNPFNNLTEPGVSEEVEVELSSEQPSLEKKSGTLPHDEKYYLDLAEDKFREMFVPSNLADKKDKPKASNLNLSPGDPNKDNNIILGDRAGQVDLSNEGIETLKKVIAEQGKNPQERFDLIRKMYKDLKTNDILPFSKKNKSKRMSYKEFYNEFESIVHKKNAVNKIINTKFAPSRKERKDILDQEYAQHGNTKDSPTMTKYVLNLAKSEGKDWKSVNDYITDDEYWEIIFTPAGG